MVVWNQQTADQPAARRGPVQRAVRAPAELARALTAAACGLNRVRLCTYHLRPFAPHGQETHHRRETVGRGRHRARARRLHAQGRLLRERQLRALVGGRPSARADAAREVRRQARQVVVRPPAGDPAALRPRADREERDAPEPAAAPDEAQGRHRAHQRLRRRARGRADLPLHRAARAQQEADRAPVAAVDDAGRRSATASRRCAPTRSCCRSPTPRSAARRPTGWSASTARAR